MTLLERLLGKSWRTTLTGIGTATMAGLAALAEAPAQLGDLSTVIPEKYKAWIFGIGAGSAFILRIIHGAISQDAATAVQKPPTP